MKQQKVIVSTYLLKLTKEDMENRKKLQSMSDLDFADILRLLMHEAVAVKKQEPVVMGDKEEEFRTFVQWINKAGFMPTEKTFTALAFKNWNARRKSYEPRQIAEAFANLRHEPDGWQLRNNGFRPLSWWLETDDRIESMKACHMKAGKGSPILQL